MGKKTEIQLKEMFHRNSRKFKVRMQKGSHSIVSKETFSTEKGAQKAINRIQDKNPMAFLWVEEC